MPKTTPTEPLPERLKSGSRNGSGPTAAASVAMLQEDRPVDMSTVQSMLAQTQTTLDRRPTLSPPSEARGASAAGAWVQNQKVNALWSKNQSRNSWVGIAGVGWRKLANNSDSAIIAMTTLCAHARQTQATINYREEADQMIHEIYVW